MNFGSMKIRFEKRERVSLRLRILTPLISVLVAFLIIGIIMKLMGYDPIKGYRYMFTGAFGSLYYFSESVLQSIPLMLASLGVAVALTMSTMNIGAEGQYVMGAWAAIGVGVFIPGIPQSLVLPLMIVAGFLAGAIWGMLATFPRAKWGVNETITTLMFNYIALQFVDYWIFGPWRDRTTMNLPVSPDLPSSSMLPTIGSTRVNVALFGAVLLAILLYIFINRTAMGYQIRVIGQSTRASRYAGMNHTAIMMLVMLLSGGLAGLAGVAQVAGPGRRLIQNVAGGAGYTAIIIARLSKNNPLLIIFISILFGGLVQGSYNLQLAAVPWQLSRMLEGAILFCALGSEIFVNNKVTIQLRRKENLTLEKGEKSV